MKKYIRASISPSTPEWLKSALTTKYGNALRREFLETAHLALDKANYSPTRTSDSDLAIYLIHTDYGDEIYSPGVNDDKRVYINGRNRALGSIAKAKLSDFIIDEVFVDRDDKSSFTDRSKERYQDPRYTYRHSPKGEYAGQYKDRPYLGGGEYGEETWSKNGRTPSNESRARDKSGYIVPSPESRLKDFYTKFPEKMTSKVDDLYQELLQLRQEVFDADINAEPDGYYSTPGSVAAYKELARAVEQYQDILRTLRMEGAGLFSDKYGIRSFSDSCVRLRRQMEETRRVLNR